MQLLESIVAKYLGRVIEKRLNPRQHGNRKNYSAQTQLFCAHEELLFKTQIHGRVDCIRMDFTRAADMVVHSILIDKLRTLCIDPLVIKWVRAFLTNRWQSTKVDNIVSEALLVTSGLPQGSPLSNVLLNIYLNDLHNLPINDDGEQINYNIYQYSDDSLIFKPITSEKDCLQLQSVIDAIGVWTKKHRMQIGSTKCQFMSFNIPGQPKFELKFSYNLQKQIIGQVDNMRYLGIIVKDDFSWVDHLRFVKQKIAFVKKITTNLILYPDAQSSFYMQNMRPKLEDLSTVWNFPLISKYHDQILEMEFIQNDAVSNEIRNRLPSLGERRLLQSLWRTSNVIKRDPPYIEILKWL